MKTKISSIYFQFFFTVVLIIFLTGGIVFYLKQTQIKIQEYLKEKEDFYNLQNKIFFLQNTNKKESLLENKEIIKIKDIFFEIKKGEIKNEKIGNFLEEIENLGKIHSLTLKTKNITEPKADNNFYLFEFEVEGDFSNFLKFLFNLENTPTKQYYLIEITRINLSRQVLNGCESGANQKECKEDLKKVKAKGFFEIRLYTKPKPKDNQGDKNLNASPSPNL